jgi:integrase/recombinase XerD
MKKSITLSQACDGLVRYKSATGMSPNTIRNYRTTFAKLQAYFAGHPERSCILSGGPQDTVKGAAQSKDPDFDAITRDQLIDFFAWLHDEYLSEPDGAAPRGQIKLSPKTILNVHTDLSGLWTWSVEEGFVPANIVRTIDPPDPKAPVVETLTKEEIDVLLAACDRSKTWKNRQLSANERPTADRDRAIILLLLDTGLRASELPEGERHVRRHQPDGQQHQGARKGARFAGTAGLLREADIEGALEAAHPASEGFQVRRPGLHRGTGG